MKKNISLKQMTCFFICAFVFLSLVVIYKSYEISLLKNKYNNIEKVINNTYDFSNQLAVTVDGQETSSFPTKDSNYSVKSIDCTNDVVAKWDNENWKLVIDDMSATSTKCTVNFKTGISSQNDIALYSKEDLLALNSEYQDMAVDTVKSSIIDSIYPVGSIYMSTTDDTVDIVKGKFGGTWVKYAQGTTLIGAISTYAANSTGGTNSISLTQSNIPSLSMTGTTDSTGSGYSIGYGSSSRGVSPWSASHGHSVSREFGINANLNINPASETYAQIAGTNAYTRSWSSSPISSTTITVSGQTVSDYYANSISGIQSHSHTFTGNYTNNSQQNINVQNPYTAVYMYKRTA